MKKIITYIDGFNFYYRAIKNTKYKWIDFESLIRNFTEEEYEILKIRYFTAKVKTRAKRNRQDTYLKAIQTNPKIKIHEGFFVTREGKYTEKCSDVNLATYMIRDACKESYDCVLLISNDVDFKTPIKTVKNEFSKDVIVLNPDKGNAASEYRKLEKETKIKLRDIRVSTLEKSQLPDPIILPDGKIIKKPYTYN